MYKLVLMVGLVWMGFISSTATARETLVLAISSGPPYFNKEGTGFSNLLEREALNRVGYDVRFDTLSGERALLYANQGISDGEGDRVKGMQKLYPNLIRVDEPTVNWEFVAFSLQHNIAIEGWQSIKQYSVGLINGWKILERNTKDVRVQTKVKDIDILFTLLKNKRADLVLMEAWQGLHYLSQHPITGVKILTPPLATKEKYMYLHKKHSKIAPKIATALREMKKDGTYKMFFDQVFAPLKKQSE